jgi:curved DNA-binding protein CbpA
MSASLKGEATPSAHGLFPTYPSPSVKTTCPKCDIELFYHPVTVVNDVKAPLLFVCVSCEHQFTPLPDSSAEEPPSVFSSITHYDTLGVERAATAEEISRAYRKKSLKCHPDRTQGREQEWEQLAKAYEILGDKRKRHWYDMELENGTADLSSPEDQAAHGIVLLRRTADDPVKTDPEKFFQDIFGGERFYDLIGMSSVGKAIGEAMLHGTTEAEPEKSAEETAADQAKDAAERAERVRMLVDNLAYKLDIFALDEDLEGRMDRWRARCKLEADELKNERFGSEILKVSPPCNQY